MNTPLPQMRQLQVNQSGAWRSVITFDVRTTPPEFLFAAHVMASLCGSHITMRQVHCASSDSGGTRPTSTVLAIWSKEKGWEEA